MTCVAGLVSLVKAVAGCRHQLHSAPLVANTGLGTGDTLNLVSNRLSQESINVHIPALQGRGVTVTY